MASSSDISASERIAWIDAAKGLSIILIVLGHIMSVAEPSAFYIYIYAFHVPLFFFVSGLTLKPRGDELRSVIIKKSKTILLPYFIYSLIGYAFYLSGYFVAQLFGLQIKQFDYGLLTPLLGIFYGTLGDGRLINTPMWFLIALFCTFMIGYVINRSVTSRLLSWMIVVALAVIGYWLSEYKLPWSLSPALVGLIFFQAGYTHRQIWPESWPKLPAWFLFVFLFILSMFSYINGFAAIANMQLGNPLMYLFFSFVGLYAVIALTQAIAKNSGLLSLLGKFSMAILVIHMLVIKSVKVIMAVLLQTSIAEIETQVLPSLLVLVLTVALLIPCVKIMERFFPISLGKPARQA